MSWQIPTLIEADIKSGKAQYRTFQTGNGGQSILPVPANSYVVIFGYDFSPAGGGLIDVNGAANSGGVVLRGATTLKWFETQQIAFYTGTDFYPFIHHVDLKQQRVVASWDTSAPDNNVVTQYNEITEVNNSPIARQVYITSTNDVTITHGLILKSVMVSRNAIPVTGRTPVGLTYGGNAQTVTTQSNYGPIATPLNFMQPSPKDYQDFAFGLLPNNADGQAFATPDATQGLRDASNLIDSIVPVWNDEAGISYYLCLHYALYTETVPESRG
jgi:hypothetical protein